MEPIFAAPDLTRYTQTAFPAYRYLPFQQPEMPHPIRDRAGHSYGREEEYLTRFEGEDWRSCEPYLYGIDLFNHGYWWEAHESLETVWMAAGQETVLGQFIQGLIQLAAAQLKRFIGQERGAKMLTESGIAKLSVAEGIFIGVEVASIIAEVERCLQEDRGEYPQIRLAC